MTTHGELSEARQANLQRRRCTQRKRMRTVCRVCHDTLYQKSSNYRSVKVIHDRKKLTSSSRLRIIKDRSPVEAPAAHESEFRRRFLLKHKDHSLHHEPMPSITNSIHEPTLVNDRFTNSILFTLSQHLALSLRHSYSSPRHPAHSCLSTTRSRSTRWKIGSRFRQAHQHWTAHDFSDYRRSSVR